MPETPVNRPYGKPEPGKARAGHPGSRARQPLGDLTPGPALASCAQRVDAAGLGKLQDDEVVDMLCASRRLASWSAALELAAVTELDRRRMAAAERPGSSRASEHVSEELAAALVLTGRSADALLGLAREIARMPAVGTALRSGRIDLDRARVFAAELARLDDTTAAAVAMVFCGVAGTMTTGQLRAHLRAMVLAIDPAAARERAGRAREQARVEYWPEGSGNSGLAGRELPEADAIAADERISAIARALKAAGTQGTIDQLRAAVFLALLAGRDPGELAPSTEQPVPGTACRDSADEPDHATPATGDTTPATGRATPATGRAGLAALAGSVHLTMPMATWLGISDTPGEVQGRGPVHADTCRDLAARLAAGSGTQWCLSLTDPGGRVLAHGCGPRSPGPTGTPAYPCGWPPWPGPVKFARLEADPCTHARRGSGYQPANLVRHLIKVRQRTCSYPGCRRPAARCDLDHTVPWDAGGLTCECNLAPLCRRHHRAKQAPGWALTQPRPGVLTWVLPHGRSYTVGPAGYPA